MSNRHLDLRPVVAALADDLALTPLILENKPTRAELENGEFPSRWVALSRSDTKLAALQSVGWKPLRESRRVPWTDDYSSIVHVISWHF